MNVLHIIQFYYPFIGGVEHHMKEHSEGLVRRGHDVTVYTTDITSITPLAKIKPGSSVINGVIVRRFQTLFPRFGSNKEGSENHRLSISYEVMRNLISKMEILFHKIDKSPHVADVTLLARSFSLPMAPQMLPTILFHKDRWELMVGASLPWATPAIAYFASKLTGIPLVSMPIFHVGRPSYECPSFYKMMRKANAVIVNTEYEKRHLTARGVPRDKIYVTGVGVDPEKYRNVGEDRFKKRVDIGEDTPVVTFVGRREYDKGYYHVIAAMEHVWKRFSNTKLVLIGPGESVKLQSNEEDALRQYCGHILQKHRDNVIDLGVTEEQEKIDAMATSDMLVMPSRAESFGITYLEAWMLRKPVIGAYSSVVPHIIRDGINGLLVEFGDKEQLAKKIMYLLQSPKLRAQLGENGYQRTRNSYTWDIVVDKVENVYRKVI